MNAGMCVAETGCKIGELTMEHQKDLWFYHPECSAVSKRSINQVHQTYFEDTMELAKLPRYIRRVIRESQKSVYLRTSIERVASSYTLPGRSFTQSSSREDTTIAVKPMQMKAQLQSLNKR